jgi:uncharacterized protein YeaO (DUF488 family)
MTSGPAVANYGLMRVQTFISLPAPRPVAVLLDRLWPRGITKEKLAGVLWEKDATPSTALRQWFHADPDARFAEFQQRFAQELQSPAAQTALARIRTLVQPSVLLLLTAAKVPERSHLVVLQQLLRSGV